eukprot:gene10424-19126_t
MAELAQESLGKAQQRQKRWYDQQASSRTLHVGQKVLVLLPLSKKKLHASWQGPYLVTKKFSDVDYEIDMHDNRKRRRIFHINMLKLWNTPENVSYLAIPRDESLTSSYEESTGQVIQIHVIVVLELFSVKKLMMASITPLCTSVESCYHGSATML